MNSNGITRILEHRFFRGVLQMCVAGTMICALATPAEADEVHRKNRAANKYYEDGDFEKALETYEDALLNAPSEDRLRINKGSALHKLGRLEEAEESYLGAAKIDDPQVKADLWYNLGTTMYKQGEQMMASGGQGAMEKFKAAKDSYIKALDARPGDEDAKWNLQLTQLVLDQLEKQQQEQQQNNENKDQNQENDKKQQNNKGDDKKQGDKNQNQDQQNEQNEQKENKENKDEQGDQSENNKDEQNKDEQQKKDGQDQEKEKREEESKGREQKKAGDKGDDQSQQSKSAEQREKEQQEKREAARLLEQYSDDHEDLNKPTERIRVLRGKEPEKDW